MKISLCCSILFASLIIFSNNVLAQPAFCSDTSALSSSSVINNVLNECCISEVNKQKNCLKKATKNIRRLKPILSKTMVKPALKIVRKVKQQQCSLDQEYFSQICEDSEGISISEVQAFIENSSCTLQYKKDRQKNLRQVRRRLKSAKKQVGLPFVVEIRKLIKGLLRSKACGQGGEEMRNPCKQIVDPRDGGVTGNVYKLSDHSPHHPVFVTHNGARHGKAIKEDGTVLDTLRYTGLANPDVNGYRHHYRLNVSCRSLPAGYYLHIGSTCYEIDSPCSRID